jgi:sugar/nucleoside kinase (ribokinase family)
MKPDILVVANPVWEIAWMVERLPVDRFDPHEAVALAADGGGSALNTACALACAGWSVAAAGRVGDDPEGLACVTALERRGVEPRIEIVHGRTTKRNHLYVERSTGATAFETTLPQRSVEPWNEAPRDIEESRLLFLDRLAAAAGGWLAIRRRRSGYLNGLNRNTPGMHGLDDPRLREACPYLDYLQIPEDAAASGAAPGQSEERQRIHRPRPFSPLTDQQISSTLDAGVRILVRTKGPDGAVIHRTRGAAISIAAIDTEVIDPTGAGDAFAAGFLDRLLRGDTLEEAGSRGAEWASRACRHPGARTWLDREPPDA